MRVRSHTYEILWVAAAALLLLLPGVWSYTLLDPWETHYAEVARRILEDGDWVFLQWQDEVFRSKPALTFWLIAASMALLGVGHGGGYSGELASSDWVVFAVRLPFVLCAVLGLVLLWWMIRSLLDRKSAWFAFAVVATTPFFYFFSRHALTDTPMLATAMGAIACFAMATDGRDQPLTRIWKRITGFHIFAAVLSLWTGVQAVCFASNLARHPLAAGPAWAGGLLAGAMAAALAGFLYAAIVRRPVSTTRPLYMFWFYFLVGLSAMAKGPAGVGVVGSVCFFYLLTTGRWRMLSRQLELVRGLIIAALVVAPWHVAMWLRDGAPFLQEYFGEHVFRRFATGVSGERGTFTYFFSQLGIGLWPWSGLIPVALCSQLIRPIGAGPRDRLRLLLALWAVTSVALFCLSETKFHHYVLPAVPALAALVGLWLADAWEGRARLSWFWGAAALAITLLVCRDLVGEQKQLIELFVFRYDRPWPADGPWFVNVAPALVCIGVATAGVITFLAVPRPRRGTVLALIVFAACSALWVMNGYMSLAAPHWGQRALHQRYLAKRQIHGAILRYESVGDLRADWAERRRLEVPVVVPPTLAVGTPATITLHVSGRHDPQVVVGVVSKVSPREFVIDVQSNAVSLPESDGANGIHATPWMQVDADRLLTWQLNWRGENFWSGGEIHGQVPSTQTVFNGPAHLLLEHLKTYGVQGRQYFVITEVASVRLLKTRLGGRINAPTFRIIDTSNNKYALCSFRL